jgi:hypothetical protein
MLPYEGKLNGEDVVGHRLVAILQSGVIELAYTNQIQTFYRLESGVTFFLPFADAGRLIAELPPPECREVNLEELRPILGQRISAVLQLPPELDWEDDSPCLLLENGYVVTDIMGSPPGIGSEGLHIFAPGELEISKMKQFFVED